MTEKNLLVTCLCERLDLYCLARLTTLVSVLAACDVVSTGDF